jgi:hypothetical protein
MERNCVVAVHYVGEVAHVVRMSCACRACFGRGFVNLKVQ